MALFKEKNHVPQLFQTAGMTAGDVDIAIIGGGFSGSLLALKLAEAGLHPVLIDPAPRAGPGLAYGAADAGHVLNVTVQRMELDLEPSFAAWLAGFRQRQPMRSPKPASFRKLSFRATCLADIWLSGWKRPSKRSDCRGCEGMSSVPNAGPRASIT